MILSYNINKGQVSLLLMITPGKVIRYNFFLSAVTQSGPNKTTPGLRALIYECPIQPVLLKEKFKQMQIPPPPPGLLISRRTDLRLCV